MGSHEESTRQSSCSAYLFMCCSACTNCTGECFCSLWLLVWNIAPVCVFVGEQWVTWHGPPSSRLTHTHCLVSCLQSWHTSTRTGIYFLVPDCHPMKNNHRLMMYAKLLYFQLFPFSYICCVINRHEKQADASILFPCRLCTFLFFLHTANNFS